MIRTCSEAARCGDIKLLKWMRLKGFEWDHKTYRIAIDKGHTNLIKWLEKNNCPRKVQLPTPRWIHQ